MSTTKEVVNTIIEAIQEKKGHSIVVADFRKIITAPCEYFVVDTNSTNHTYVNGALIQSNVETNITNGTKIRFANEDFEFKLV